MTTILAPTATGDTVSTADQIIEVLATYADQHNGDTGGGHQNTMLLAALITRLFDITPSDAIELARHDAFDPRVQVAGQARDHILDRVHRARLTHESWTPQPGDTVTWNGHNGIWTVTGIEDDDNAWLRPQRDAAPITPAGTFLDHLVSTGAHFGPLAAIADLRPTEAAAEVTV